MKLDVARLLFAPMLPFVGHPERLAAIAAACLVLAAVAFLVTRRGSWALVALGIVWALVAAWEQYCLANHYNIRVDLFFIAPTILPLAIGTLYTAGQAFQGELQKQFSLRTLLMSTTLVAVALGLAAWLTS